MCEVNGEDAFSPADKLLIPPTHNGSGYSNLCVYVKAGSVQHRLKGRTVLPFLCVDVCLNLCIGAHISVVYFRLDILRG